MKYVIDAEEVRFWDFDKTLIEYFKENADNPEKWWRELFWYLGEIRKGEDYEKVENFVMWVLPEEQQFYYGRDTFEVKEEAIDYLREKVWAKVLEERKAQYSRA